MWSILAMVMRGGGGGDAAAAGEDFFNVLPEGCIADIVSLTTPRDACRLCLVSTIFRSAAESDAVWDRFLPPDCLSIAPSQPCPSKKQLFLSLCDRPVLIDEGTKSFSLDKLTGKKCFMLSARSLAIVWGDTPRYWRWVSLPDARFDDVAELISVCWFEVRGKTDISRLSPATLYTANLVFKSTVGSYGFEHQPVEATVGIVGGEKQSRTVYLEIEQRQPRNRFVPRRFGALTQQLRNNEPEFQAPAPVGPVVGGPENGPKMRKDGWYEVELGEFFCDGRSGEELEMSVTEVRGGDWKGGLIFQGIEIRPSKKTLREV